jgi:hypothetical protein
VSLSQNILILKLDEFIRKYYKNQLIRGLLYTSGLLVAAFLFLVVAEYFAEFGTTTRTVLFYLFVAISGFVLTRFIIIPALKLNKLGAVISYEEAANIVGKHFSNINDKLLNTLQLQSNFGSILSPELLTASINQKMEELRPIPFTSAINLGENKRYLKFALPPIVAMLLVFAVKPAIITNGTERILYHQTYFEKTAPFQFALTNTSLEAIQQQDYVLALKLNGNEIPNEVFISVDGVEHKMEKVDNINYTYTFKNVQKDQDFVFNAAGFNSRSYELKVLPKPMLMKFDIKLTYPAYLNKKNETVSNVGDMQVPQGTKLQWVFHTKNTDNIFLNFTDTLVDISRLADDEFTFSKNMMRSTTYSIKTMNHFLKQNPDSVNYALNVVPDQVPLIEVSEKTDSVNPKNIYFSGTVKDDYGFSRLMFKYVHYTQDSLGKPVVKNGEQLMGINKQQITQPYFYFLDASRFDLLPGDKIEYYFEVWDNDGVSGAKSAKTQTMLFKAPTVDEMNEATDKNNSEIKKDLDDGIKKAKELQKDINELSKKLMDKKQMGWEEKKKLEDLLKKQNELKNKIEETKQENQLNNQQQQEFSPPDESLLEKQKQLEQLFENIMTPEMKKLFDELNKMLDKLDKNQVQQKLDELKLSNKDMEKELDRTLEAFKQMEVEQKMQQAIDKLDELKNKEDALKQETDGKKAEENKDNKDNKNPDSKDNKDNKDGKQPDSKELEKKQNELNKEFDKLKEDLKEMQEKNAALEQPNELPKTEEKQNEISKEMKNSSEQLNQNNKKNASKSQKSASDKMEEMKQQMQQAMDEMEKEQAGEDMAALRQILENLLNLSFAQEDLMGQLSKLRTDNPQYLKVTQTQKKLQDDSRIIEDSLLALSKRVPEISAVVNREISAINMNMGKAVSELAERMQANAQMRMQYSMTSINNLALLLNESLEQMQAEAKKKKEGKPGNGKCKKPGKGEKPSSSSKPGQGKPSMANMKQMQQQLNKQLEELKKQLEQQGNKPGQKPGQKPGGQKPGGQSGMGQQGQPGQQPGMLPGQGQGMSEQLAKMAAQQEALRRQMQQMMDKIKKEGGSNPGGNLTDLMEQTERDIVNRQITQETMKRQQDIITKLLESEKAEREREQDEQRKSNEAKNQNLSNPTQFLEYKRLKEKELELLNTVSPSLTPYYKQKVNEYFNSVNK